MGSSILEKLNPLLVRSAVIELPDVTVPWDYTISCSFHSPPYTFEIVLQQFSVTCLQMCCFQAEPPLVSRDSSPGVSIYNLLVG